MKFKPLNLNHSNTKFKKLYVNRPNKGPKSFLKNTQRDFFVKSSLKYNNIASTIYSGKIFLGLPYLSQWILYKLPKVLKKINKYKGKKRNKPMNLLNESYFSELDFDITNFNIKTSKDRLNFTKKFISDKFLILMLKQYYKKEKLTFRIMRKKMFNFILFINGFMYKLNLLVSNIYNKNVVINIINLKYIYMNSYLLNRAILVKLRNLRKSSLYSILARTTSLVKIKKRNAYSYDLNSPIFKYINKHHNSYVTLNRDLFNVMPLSKNENLTTPNKSSKINSIFSDDYLYQNIDNKNLLGFDLSKNDKKINSNIINNSLHKNIFNLYSKNIFSNVRSLSNIQNNTLNFIKYKSVFGIKLHASGRLTRRYTASRAVNKYRFKGSLKNNSLITRCVKTVVVKNNIIGNIEFSKLNSKIRTGAFGIKGWVNTN